MVDGFLLFAVLDVWRMVLPLGLTLLLLMTGMFGRWQGDSSHRGLYEVLSLLVVRLTLGLLVLSGIVGLLVPAILGYPLPESHIAEGPWCYEEMLGYVLGGVCLWKSRQHDGPGKYAGLVWPGCAGVLFFGSAVLWVGRWDAMAHEGHVAGGWFVLGLSTVDWTRVVPKSLHLLFASLATGGLVVTLLGLLGWSGASAGSASLSRPRTLPSDVHVRYGVGWMLSGLVPQMFIGPWLFLVLGEVPRGGLIDGTGLPSVLFFVGVMAALVALVLLNASFMAPQVKGLVWGGLLCILITLVLMGMIRYVMFLDTLQAQGIPIAIGSVTLFHLLIVLVLTGLVGAILVRWCLRPLPVLHSSQAWQRD
ncbi:MAG: hypothetical protein CO149_05605 [Nitrospirae bacterium CG_4_9_14_3_um_filter_51_5]|nr:MAG: hypothetical protein CO149_05605 [Nitrospirae bacterium CG_4_9_14_3_um_filter_51_5]